jgi:hypothetical protein
MSLGSGIRKKPIPDPGSGPSIDSPMFFFQLCAACAFFLYSTGTTIEIGLNIIEEYWVPVLYEYNSYLLLFICICCFV